jgi:hypothetical protein
VCAPAPLTEADFELGGINAVTDDLETALKNGGKLRVEYERDSYIPPTHVWVFKDIKMYTDIYTKEILLLTTEEEMVETPRGIRVGSTKHKVIKEYGQPQKATKNGMVCFIYQMGGKRIIFDVTAGHVEAIMINCMPSATMTLEGE